jgi:hypothetical protein
MNNVAKYSIIIELLCDAISHGVQYLEVHLDSQLVVCQLNDMYQIRDPTLLPTFPSGYDFWNNILILLLTIIYLEVLIKYPMHMLITF